MPILLIDILKQRAITSVISPKAIRKAPRAPPRAQLVERFFSKIKHFRAIAARYDKVARNFLAVVRLVSLWFFSTEDRP